MNKYKSSFIDEALDIKKEPTYSLIRKYFGNLTFTKLKDSENFSIYICKIGSYTNNKPYLIATILKNNEDVGSTKLLSSLFWISFQTRTLPENYAIQEQNYTRKRDEIYESEIKVVKRTEEKTEYVMSNKKFPLRITLLHSKKCLYEFPEDVGTLNSALESYCTVLTF